ncbi:MAG: membrane protein insertase YidC [Gammaproteobacteria bacterium]|nr:membrane protein insertase YidC [Gammaproteobacteria bacterium]
MENQRTLLYMSLFFILFLIWDAWQKDYAPKPAVVAEQPSTSVAAPASTALDTPEASSSTMVMTPSIASTQSPRKTVKVVTDLLDLEIDTQGGDVSKLLLRKYPQDAENLDVPFELFGSHDKHFHIAQSGLVSKTSPVPDNQNQHAIYETTQDQYRLAEGQDSLQVTLVWQQNDVKVQKIYTFHRNSYVIDVEHVVNAGTNVWSGQQYRQLKRARPDKDSESMFIYTYTGGVIYNEEAKYKKIDFDDLGDQDFLKEKNLDKNMTGGWTAMIQHYFLAAWVPDQKESNKPYTFHIPLDNHYVLGLMSPLQTINAGEQGRFHSQLVVGPKLQDSLQNVAPGLELTIDYGVLTILAKPLFWLLKFFHTMFDNWGWAIIFLTISVKVLFYKLSETSYRSMARMRKIAPRLQTLKERFGDDRQAMSQAMMKMYKEEKINPLGGCLPILVQIPVFIALYWVLLESVEMRNAPFALWITNLSIKDPYFILPLIMGVSMFVQQKLNPAPIDPMQQKIFQIMPIMFTVFFAFFPAGLVLYWVVNNLLSIAQQWMITRRIEAEK